MDDDRGSSAPSGAVWALGYVAAGLGVVGGFLRFFRGTSFHWIDLAGDFSGHLPILGAVIRGLIAPALLSMSAPEVAHPEMLIRMAGLPPHRVGPHQHVPSR